MPEPMLLVLFNGGVPALFAPALTCPLLPLDNKARRAYGRYLFAGVVQQPHQQIKMTG